MTFFGIEVFLVVPASVLPYVGLKGLAYQRNHIQVVTDSITAIIINLKTKDN
jgi:hypothetical protein